MIMQLSLLLLISLFINGVMFVIAYRQQTDKLTDISYAVSFATLALCGLIVGGVKPLKLVLAIMVTLWAYRLGRYLLVRIRKIGKDKRFDGIRSDFKKFGKFWIGQGLSVWLILLPVLLLDQKEVADFAPLSAVGVAIWAAGLLIEATADRQKFAFMNNSANRDKWIDSGIWRYSRHPNYFGEILVWSGVLLAALPALNTWEVIFGVLSPLYIAILLIFVSGIPPLERQANKRWGHLSAYHDYKRRTSPLVLLPRKK
jgi:steroid 5-alpha reductase family enzyme